MAAVETATLGSTCPSILPSFAQAREDNDDAPLAGPVGLYSSAEMESLYGAFAHGGEEINAGPGKGPLIGILAQPCESCPSRMYINAAYAKMVQLAGGRAVPIRYYDSKEELWRLFKSVNGMIWPGGLTWLYQGRSVHGNLTESDARFLSVLGPEAALRSVPCPPLTDEPYVWTARQLYQWAVEANDAGNPFPIWGTCLGFQLLQMLMGDVMRDELLVPTDSVDHATTLTFTDAGQRSKLLGTLDPRLFAIASDPAYNITMENVRRAPRGPTRFLLVLVVVFIFDSWTEGMRWKCAPPCASFGVRHPLLLWLQLRTLPSLPPAARVRRAAPAVRGLPRPGQGRQRPHHHTRPQRGRVRLHHRGEEVSLLRIAVAPGEGAGGLVIV